MSKLTVVGLGPGRAGLITREVWNLLTGKTRIILRTSVHPTVETLQKEGIRFTSYDSFYRDAENFESLYKHIAREILEKAVTEDLVYAVPGSPLVAERTVVLLRNMAVEYPMIELCILPAMSFVEVLYTELGIDPVEGLTILDATDIEDFLFMGSGNLPHGILVTQVYDSFIASNLKLSLMERYPDDMIVTYIYHLALSDEDIRQIPLYALDRQKDVDHLTSLFVPAVRLE